MSNFKIGEKVVYIPIEDNTFHLNKSCNIPKKYEIVTIKSFCNTYDKNIDIKEYLYDENGTPQSFHIRHFRKLDHSFGEKICNEILESIKVKEEQLN